MADTDRPLSNLWAISLHALEQKHNPLLTLRTEAFRLSNILEQFAQDIENLFRVLFR